MTQPILRVLIQEKLAKGGVPHTHMLRIWGGPRNGETCDGCEEAVTKAERTLPPMRTHPAMSKGGLLRGLTLAAFAALGTMTCAASAGAATLIYSCQTLSTFGATYVLAADLTATTCGDCLVVVNDSITIDLADHKISGSGSCGGDGVTDGGTARPSTTVKNGTINNFQVGVNLGSSTRSLISDLTSSDNSANGILLGARSLVRGCMIDRNGQDGIIIGEFSRVQDCLSISDNGGNGISGGSRLLIMNNVVLRNVGTGISVVDFSTVSFNISSENGVYGVLAGDHSLVIDNDTHKNGHTFGHAGIATGGLSSLSNNTSNENGGGGIDAGDGLFGGTRSLLIGNTTNDNAGIGVEAWCPSTVTNHTSSGNAGNIANRGVVPGKDKNYLYNGPGVCQGKNNK